MRKPRSVERDSCRLCKWIFGVKKSLLFEYAFAHGLCLRRKFFSREMKCFVKTKFTAEGRKWARGYKGQTSACDYQSCSPVVLEKGGHMELLSQHAPGPHVTPCHSQHCCSSNRHQQPGACRRHHSTGCGGGAGETCLRRNEAGVLTAKTKNPLQKSKKQKKQKKPTTIEMCLNHLCADIYRYTSKYI